MMYNEKFKYEIVDFNESAGQITVYCIDLGQKYSIDLPVDNNRYPQGDDLDLYIRGYFPSWFTERADIIKSGIENVDYIKGLIPEKKSPEYTRDVLREVRFRRNNLLACTDWTQLPDNGLSEEEKQSYRNYRQNLRDITKQDIQNIVWPTG
jgi:hypothetical protein